MENISWPRLVLRDGFILIDTPTFPFTAQSIWEIRHVRRLALVYCSGGALHGVACFVGDWFWVHMNGNGDNGAQQPMGMQAVAMISCRN